MQAKCDHYIQPTNGESEVIKIQNLNHAVWVTVCELHACEQKEKGREGKTIANNYGFGT